MYLLQQLAPLLGLLGDEAPGDVVFEKSTNVRVYSSSPSLQPRGNRVWRTIVTAIANAKLS